MLTGKQPFKGENYKLILKANKECQIDYKLEELKSVPAAALDLLMIMLSPNPKNRLSCADCMKHKFFTEDYSGKNTSAQAQTKTNAIMANLKNFEVEFTSKLQCKEKEDVEI